MTRLDLLGLGAALAMLVSWWAEEYSPWFIISFAGACLLMGVYGIVAGAWPIAVVEVAWAALAIREWWKKWNI